MATPIRTISKFLLTMATIDAAALLSEAILDHRAGRKPLEGLDHVVADAARRYQAVESDDVDSDAIVKQSVAEIHQFIMHVNKWHRFVVNNTFNCVATDTQHAVKQYQAHQAVIGIIVADDECEAMAVLDVMF